MSTTASFLLLAAGLVPLVGALVRTAPGPRAVTVEPAPRSVDGAVGSRAPIAQRPAPLADRHPAGTLTRTRPRTVLQVSACLFTADVPWRTAQAAVDRVTAGEVDTPVLVDWLDRFGETATALALVSGLDADGFHAVLEGRRQLDLESLRLLAELHDAL